MVCINLEKLAKRQNTRERCNADFWPVITKQAMFALKFQGVSVNQS